jgi:hypothetical protein
MKNAGMAHTLTHWRFHLNEWVVEHLRTTGYMSDRRIIKRSHMSQKKKNKHAAKAFTKMVESGEVKKLWRDFHINLRTARESTVCFHSHDTLMRAMKIADEVADTLIVHYRSAFVPSIIFFP